MKKKHLNGVLFTDDMRKNHRAAMDRLVASGTQIHPCPNHWTKTEAGRKKVSQLKLGKKLGQTAREHMSQGAARRVRTKRETHYTSACGGTRADLGMYFRSNWEANFARIQNFLGKTWEYESQTFKLSSTMSYTPDFKIDDTFYELKGRMTDLCMEKFKIMNDKFPDIKDKFPDIKIVGPEEYTELRKQYKNKVKWEGK